MWDAERLLDAGVRETLLVSWDTTAYGTDIRYRTEFWNDRRMTVLADVANAPEIVGVVVAIGVSKANVGDFLAVKIIIRTRTTGMRDPATRRR